jgi:heptosyltransferase-2
MKIIDLVGKTSLLELIALYGACQLVITHDSGPMHMATLAAVPVLALFGPTNPIEKVPSEMPVRVLWGGCNLACRPCYDGKEYANCRDNACMKDITVEAVHQAACHMLKLKC